MRYAIGCILVLSLLGGGCGDDNSTQSPVPSDSGSTNTAQDVVSDAVDPPDTDLGPDIDAVASACASLAEGAVCDDGNACTELTTCQGGFCVGGVSVACSPGPCEASMCDPSVGCLTEPLDDGAPCSLSCFDDTTCQSGVCTGTPRACPKPTEPCVDALACDSQTGDCTIEIVIPKGTPCQADGDFCTAEACDGNGVCAPTGEVETCADEQAQNPCWTWQCNQKAGCQKLAFLDASSCNDGNVCTQSDQCTTNELGQKLCLGTPLDIDDKNPCTDDKCTATGVSHDPLTGSSCALPAQSPCAIGQCDQGQCAASPLPDGTACGEGGACASGQCSGGGPDACTQEGLYRYCEADCSDYTFPMQVCASGTFGACECRPLTTQQADQDGNGIGASLAMAGDEPVICYQKGGQMTLARRSGGQWSQATVGKGVDCDLASDGGTVWMIYGFHHSSNHPRLTFGEVSDTALINPETPEPAADRNGYEGALAVRNGVAHIVTGEILGVGSSALRYFQRSKAGAWSAETISPLPDSTFSQDITVCDDGAPFVAYLDYQSSAWRARIAIRSPAGAWTTALLDDSSEKIGAGPAVRCQGPSAQVLYQDFTNQALRFAAGPAGATTGFALTDFDAGEAVGFHTALAVRQGWLFAAYLYPSGSVALGVRRADLTTPWQFHVLASQAQWDAGALTGTIDMAFDTLGRPVVLFFGAFAGKDGPWIVTL